MANADPSASPDAEVTTTTSLISTDDYRNITSFDDAMRLVEDKFGGEIYSADMLGDGFTLVEGNDDKVQFIGSPMLILSATLHDSKTMKNDDGSPKQFAVLRIVTKDGRKAIVTDGSTGIMEQVKAMRVHVPASEGKPIYVPKGFRVSEYVHPQHGAAKTFYLDTSAG